MKVISYTKRKWWPLLFGLLVLGSCARDDKQEEPAYLGTADTYTADVALRWNELYLELERFTTGYRPPVSARATAYIGLAVSRCERHARQQPDGRLFSRLGYPAT